MSTSSWVEAEVGESFLLALWGSALVNYGYWNKTPLRHSLKKNKNSIVSCHRVVLRTACGGTFLGGYYLANDYERNSLTGLPYVAGRVISAHSPPASAEKLFYTSGPWGRGWVVLGTKDVGLLMPEPRTPIQQQGPLRWAECLQICGPMDKGLRWGER